MTFQCQNGQARLCRVSQNLKEAVQAAKSSIELGNEAAKIELGEIQEDEKLMKEGFNALKNKVDSGDMHYANSLGYAYEEKA